MAGAPRGLPVVLSPQPQGTGKQGPPQGGAAGGPPLGRQPLRAGRVPGSPEKNAGLPISGRLCLISCLPGRPEPAPLAGPPVPRSQGRRGPPGTRAREGARGVPGRGGGAAPAHLSPCVASASGTRQAAPTPLENPPSGLEFSTRTFGGSNAGWGREGNRGAATSRGSGSVNSAWRRGPGRGGRPSPSSVLPVAIGPPGHPGAGEGVGEG